MEMPEFEYLVEPRVPRGRSLRRGREDVSGMLNKLGVQGWRLIVFDGDNYIFERRIQVDDS